MTDGNLPSQRGSASAGDSSAQGVNAELHGTVARARDERFRLIRMIKECESRLGKVSVVAPADKIRDLKDKVQALDTAVQRRFEHLEQTEATVTSGWPSWPRSKLPSRN